jgi:hypothetical protein
MEKSVAFKILPPSGVTTIASSAQYEDEALDYSGQPYRILHFTKRRHGRPSVRLTENCKIRYFDSFFILES